VRASRARDATAKALAESEHARTEAEAVSEFLVGAFKSPDPSADGTKLRVVELLDGAVKRLNADARIAPAIKGKLLHVLGVTYKGLGQHLKAKGAMEKAVEVREAALGATQRDTLDSRISLVLIWALAGGMDDAVVYGRSTLAACEAALEPWDELAIMARGRLGNALWYTGRKAEAASVAEESVRLCEGHLPEDSPITLSCRRDLAEEYRDTGRNAEALAQFQRCLVAAERSKGRDDPAAVELRDVIKGLLVSMGREKASTLAEQETTLKRYQEKFDTKDFGSVFIQARLALTRYYGGGEGDVIAPLEAVIAASRTEIGADHPQTLDWERSLAKIRLDRGQYDEAIAALEGVVARFDAKLRHALPGAIEARYLLALAYRDLGRIPEAIRLLESTARDIANSGCDPRLVLMIDSCLGETYAFAGRWAEAKSLLERSVARSEATLGLDDVTTESIRFSVAAAPLWADPNPARSAEPLGVCEAILRRREEGFSKTDSVAVNYRANLFDLYFTAGRLDEAAAAYDESVPRQSVWDRDSTDRLGWSSRRGEIHLRRKEYAAAEPLIVRGYESMKAHESWLYPIWKDRLPETADRVVRLYEAWGKPEKAAEWRGRIKSDGVKAAPAAQVPPPPPIPHEGRP
jgi:tetratricopeptide (TPR) repeat protein